MNMIPIEVTDSRGQAFTYPNRWGRSISHIVVASYPAFAATSFSSAVAAKREIAGGALSLVLAVKLAMHHKKNFAAFDIELIEIKTPNLK